MRIRVPWARCWSGAGLAACLAILCQPAGVVIAQEIRRAIPVGKALAGEGDTDLAAFLAGRTVPVDSPLAGVQQSPAYAGHGAAMERLWRHYDAQYFAPMRAWAAAELDPRINPSRPVLYYFGGPDAINALALYPSAPEFILIGLESVGEITPPSTLEPAALQEALANLRKSVEVALSYGHFITKDMRADLDRTAFRGVLPIIFVAIGLTGGEIVSTEYFAIGTDGLTRSLGPLLKIAPGELPGVRVMFRRFPLAPVQAIHYVRADLSDAGLSKNRAILTWAAGHGTPNSYLKAASYLMHGGGFGMVTRDLLDRSASILQDDSGIPFRMFREGGWRLWFFGTYTGTLEIFSKHEQPDLRAAFAYAPPLLFGTGYKWRRGESNLMLAVRPEPASPAATPSDPARSAGETAP